MAIRKLTDVPTEELIGKFFCAPSMLSEQDHGSPAQIKSSSRSQIVYVKLESEWNTHEKEWRFLPYLNQEDQEQAKKCKKSSKAFVCDTAEEAIALYFAATAARKRIENFRTEQLQLVALQAQQGTLPIPPYLHK